MTFYTINNLQETNMAPGLYRRAVYLDKVMLTFVDFEPGVALPLHNHPHEQITLVLEGTIEFTLDDEIRILHAGQGVTVASNVMHTARSLDGPARVLDAWRTVRDDYK